MHIAKIFRSKIRYNTRTDRRLQFVPNFRNAEDLLDYEFDFRSEVGCFSYRILIFFEILLNFEMFATDFPNSDLIDSKLDGNEGYRC